MPKRYVYPGTDVLKNRLGIRDLEKLQLFERIASIERSTEPVKGFTADIDGLKAVHKTLFQDVYEWAGKTRADEITIEGKTFTPDKHVLSKGLTTFGASHLSKHVLPQELARARDRLDDFQNRGILTKVKWAEVTADQIGMINHAHPFREGNGRSMRHFIELSAERYGFRANIAEITKEEWMQASHDAMDYRETGALASLLDRVTTTELSRSSAKEARDQEASADKSGKRKGQGAQLTDAAEKAVKAINDPKRPRRSSIASGRDTRKQEQGLKSYRPSNAEKPRTGI